MKSLKEPEFLIAFSFEQNDMAWGYFLDLKIGITASDERTIPIPK